MSLPGWPELVIIGLLLLCTIGVPLAIILGVVWAVRRANKKPQHPEPPQDATASEPNKQP